MNREPLSILEKTLLDEVIRPAITCTARNIFRGTALVSETLDFDQLIKSIKAFYEKNGGVKWNELISKL